MANHHPSSLILLGLIPLLAWRIYARTKRMVGRQRLRVLRSWLQVLAFSTLALLLAAATLVQPERLALLAAGLGAGAWLGGFGLRKTQFEPTPLDLYYTPNAHLGIALSLLFAARVVYRLVQIFVLDTAGPDGLDGADFARSPLTLAVFGLLAGYYVRYGIGLLVWRAKVLRDAV